MPEEATEIADKQTIYLRRFDEHVRAELKAAGHRHADRGTPHHDGPAAQRRAGARADVFPRAAVADKYAILAVKPFAEYRIVALSGRRGVPPRAVDDLVFKSPEEALHGVFLKRVQDLMES